MAILRLWSGDREDAPLPGVCMRGGFPATIYKHKTFSWFPSWIYVLLLLGLLPFAVVALVLTRRKRLAVPLCDAHRHHWLWPQLLLFGSFAALLILGFGALLLMEEEAGPQRNAD